MPREVTHFVTTTRQRTSSPSKFVLERSSFEKMPRRSIQKPSLYRYQIPRSSDKKSSRRSRAPADSITSSVLPHFHSWTLAPRMQSETPSPFRVPDMIWVQDVHRDEPTIFVLCLGAVGPVSLKGIPPCSRLEWAILDQQVAYRLVKICTLYGVLLIINTRVPCQLYGRFFTVSSLLI